MWLQKQVKGSKAQNNVRLTYPVMFIGGAGCWKLYGWGAAICGGEMVSWGEGTGAEFKANALYTKKERYKLSNSVQHLLHMFNTPYIGSLIA